MKEGGVVDLSGYVEVDYLDTVKVFGPFGHAYSPTLMFKDESNRMIAVSIDEVEQTLDTLGLKGVKGVGSAYLFLSEALRVLGQRVEGAFIHDVEGTEVFNLRFHSKIVFRDVNSGELKEVEGRVTDVISMALVNNAPIYVRKDVMDKASKRSTQDFEETVG